MDVAGAAAGWLLGRLRADAEAGLWSALRGLVVGDPLSVALEQVTEEALRAAVHSPPGGAGLASGDVEYVVAVLGAVWPTVEVHRGSGGSLLGRLKTITADAMAACATPVQGLGDEFEQVSPLAVLERDHGLVLDPEGFSLELAFCWQRGVRDTAVSKPVLAALAGELRGEIGHELVDAAREDMLAALAGLATTEVVREGFDDVTRQLHEMRDDLGGVAVEAGFSQFVGVPDHNPAFVGRADELAELGEDLAGGGATVITQVAAGLGGVGKTTLAAEFCHRHRERLDVVRWLPADDREALVTAYVGMGPALGLTLTGLGLEDAIARVRAWFETTDRSWLLVFDNAEIPNVLDGLLPQAGRGRVLVTSRYRDWSRTDAEVLRVGVLETDDAVALLTKRSGRPQAPDAEDLVVWLGGLALAVEQAAAFCRQTGWAFNTYRKHMERRAGENPGVQPRGPTPHPRR